MRVHIKTDFKNCLTTVAIKDSSAYCQINGPTDCIPRIIDTNRPYIEVRFFSEYLNNNTISLYYAEIIEKFINLIVIPLDNNRMIQVNIYVINFELFGLISALNSVLINFMIAGIPIINNFYAVGSNHNFEIYDMEDRLFVEHKLSGGHFEYDKIKQAMIEAYSKINDMND